MTIAAPGRQHDPVERRRPDADLSLLSRGEDDPVYEVRDVGEAVAWLEDVPFVVEVHDGPVGLSVRRGRE